MAPLLRRTDAWMQMMREHYGRMGGRQSRSAASNIFPHLNSTSPSTMRAFNPHPQGSAATRIYPHLQSSSAARMQKHKPKPRQTIARRLYGQLE
jgi:hypothetical protein